MRRRVAQLAMVLAIGVAGCAGPAPRPSSDPFDTLASRPLATPTPGDRCPVSPVDEISPEVAPASGTGPIRAVLGARAGHFSLAANSITAFGRYQMKALWLALEPADTRILIRVTRLDGGSPLPGFASPGSAPDAEGMSTQLRLGPEGSVEFGQPDDWRAWSSGTLVPAIGCYAFQMDTERATHTIVFETVE